MKSVPKSKQTNKVQKPEAERPAPVASLTIGETAPMVALVAEVAPAASIPTPTIVEAVAPPVVAVPTIAELPISSIRLDGGTQSRAQLSEDTIAEYAEAMTAGATFPPVVVFYDGKTRWLADGYHRVNASRKVGRDRITCDVRQGSQRDAILFSVGANATHGLRRTNADKRHAVELLLGDAKWSKKSDRWIADTCGVSGPTVARAREGSTAKELQLPPAREGKDGKARKLPKAKPKEPAHVTPGPVAFAMAPVDEASARADLESDLGRHLLGWMWAPDSFAAVLESVAKKARDQFERKEASNA